MSFPREEMVNFVKSMEDSFRLNDLWHVLEYWWYLSSYLWVAGLWNEYVRCERLALESCTSLLEGKLSSFERETMRRVNALLLSEFAILEMELDRLDKAEEYAILGEQVAGDANDWACLARIRRYSAFIKYRIGEYSEALRMCDSTFETIDYYLKNDALASQAPLRVALSEVLGVQLEDTMNGSGYGSDEEVMAANRQQIYYLQASIHMRNEDFEAARARLELAKKEIEENLSLYKYWQVTLPLHFGSWYLRQNRLQEARMAFQEFLQKALESGRRDMEAGALLRLAEVSELLEDDAEARANTLQAVSVFRELGKAAEIRRAMQVLRKLDEKKVS